MRLLLDTHIALWLVLGDDRLTRCENLLLDPNNQSWVSVVSIWEIAIKHRQRRQGARDAVMSGREALAAFGAAGLHLLPISAENCAVIDDLPDHHADPFDRMLIAQARSEPMTLLTSDKQLPAYGDHVLLV